MIVTFDPELHGYAIDGRPAPGVHEIGDELNLTGAHEFMPERAKTFGQYAHEAIELDLRGRLDEASCPALMPTVHAARQALRELGITVAKDQVEVLVGNAGLWYATKIDALGSMAGPDGTRIPVAINWKTGIRMWFHALQAAAERLCLPGGTWRSAAIYLHPDQPNPDGTPYTAVWYDDPRDESLWRAACELYDAKCRANQSVRPRGVRKFSESTETSIPLPIRTAESLFAVDPDRDAALDRGIFPWIDSKE